MTNNTANWLLLSILLLLTLLALTFSLYSGPIHVTFSQLYQIISDNGTPITKTLPFLSKIILRLRLPLTLNAFTTGALLALSGALMQILLRNPLADPYILGISGGAALAALVAMWFGIMGMCLHMTTFAGALLAMLLVFGLSYRKRALTPLRLLLTGIVLATGWGALISFVLIISPNHDLHSMLFWLLGSIGYQQIAVPELSILTFGLLVSMLLAPQLDILTQGDLAARSLGISTNKLYIILFILTSLLTATAVSIAGTIGFVGLIVPHILRLLGLRKHLFLLPGATLCGGALLTVAASLARTVMVPTTLPVGIITALIGVPLFLLLLHQRSV